MYEEAIKLLDTTLEALDAGDYDEANDSVSMMEAYLPLPRNSDEYETTDPINRTASRFTSLVFNLPKEDRAFQHSRETFAADLREMGTDLREAMREESPAQACSVNEDLLSIQQRVESTGPIKRIPEDSAAGKVLKAYLESSTGSSGLADDPYSSDEEGETERTDTERPN